jgi:hypothetical protein
MCAVVQRVLDWFWGLNLVQKALGVLFAALLLFVASFLIGSAVFRSMGGASEQANTPSNQSAAAGSHDTDSANPEKMRPDVAVMISNARWDGQKAVVEGTWKGEVSSVHCDLWEGTAGGAPTRWWDRSAGTQMDWLGQSFTQDFVSARGNEASEPLDPLAKYSVRCWGSFAGNVMTSASAPVKGKPTG